MNKRVYTGEPLERGGTSIAGKMAPAIATLQQRFQPNSTILDYGAGKSGRNANPLRDQGHRVYAYDPYNGVDGADGWSEVTKVPPSGQFDIGFTCFVLNVVPQQTENEIVNILSLRCQASYHVTRNKDIFDMAKKALGRGDPTVTEFFVNHFATQSEIDALHNGQMNDSTIYAFCEHGFQTSRGFQRIPTGDESGLSVIERKSGYITFEKK